LAAAITCVVGTAAAALASLIIRPIPVKSEDAVAIASGTTFTKEDICDSRHEKVFE
jgi:hypothetical protein